MFLKKIFQRSSQKEANFLKEKVYQLEQEVELLKKYNRKLCFSVDLLLNQKDDNISSQENFFQNDKIKLIS